MTDIFRGRYHLKAVTSKDGKINRENNETGYLHTLNNNDTWTSVEVKLNKKYQIGQMSYLSLNPERRNRSTQLCRERYFVRQSNGTYNRVNYGWGIHTHDFSEYTSCMLCGDRVIVTTYTHNPISDDGFLRDTHIGESLCNQCRDVCQHDGVPLDTIKYLKSRGKINGQVIDISDVDLKPHFFDRDERLKNMPMPKKWYIMDKPQRLLEYSEDEHPDHNIYDIDALSNERIAIAEIDITDPSCPFHINARPVITIPIYPKEDGRWVATTLLPLWVGECTVTTPQDDHVLPFQILQGESIIFNNRSTLDEYIQSHMLIYSKEITSNAIYDSRNLYIDKQSIIYESTDTSISAYVVDGNHDGSGGAMFFMSNNFGYERTKVKHNKCYNCKRVYRGDIHTSCSGRICNFKNKIHSFDGKLSSNAIISWAASKNYSLIDEITEHPGDSDVIELYQYSRCMISGQLFECDNKPKYCVDMDGKGNEYLGCCEMCRWRILGRCEDDKEFTPPNFFIIESNTKKYLIVPSNSIEQIMKVHEVATIVEKIDPFGIPKVRNCSYGIDAMHHFITYLLSAQYGEEELFKFGYNDHNTDANRSLSNYINMNKQNMFTKKEDIYKDKIFLSTRYIAMSRDVPSSGSFRSPRFMSNAINELHNHVSMTYNKSIFSDYIDINGNIINDNLKKFFNKQNAMLNNMYNKGQILPSFMYFKMKLIKMNSRDGYTDHCILFPVTTEIISKRLTRYENGGGQYGISAIDTSSIVSMYNTLVNIRCAAINFAKTNSLIACIKLEKNKRPIIYQSDLVSTYFMASKRDSDKWNLPDPQTEELQDTPTFIIWFLSRAGVFKGIEKKSTEMTSKCAVTYDKLGRRVYTIMSDSGVIFNSYTIGVHIHLSSLTTPNQTSLLPIGASYHGTYIRNLVVYTYKKTPHWQLYISKHSMYDRNSTSVFSTENQT
jgi:hypothetical protein